MAKANPDKHIMCADCTLIGTLRLLNEGPALRRWARHSQRTKKGGTRFIYTCGPCSIQRKVDKNG
jgi:transcription initiation factor TFIIIB Brf1 subunit/transcription initiation factor TFIIB